LAAYDKYWDIVRTERARNFDYRAEGRAEGKAEGLAENEEERKQLADALEKTEAALAEKNVNIVLNGIRANLSIDTLRVVTGLSEEQIRSIIKTHEEKQ
jgi:predicted transposase YdaD